MFLRPPRFTLRAARTARHLAVLALLALAGGAEPLQAQTYPGHWRARWIWDDGAATPYHHFLYARKTFDLAAAPGRAELKVTVSDRYLLYVNGEYIGRGPARSDPRFVSLDTYDLAAHLRPGPNTLAVLAYHYGTINGYTRDARAGLLAQLELQEAGGRVLVVGSDASWKVRPAQAWSKEAARINDGIGINEVYDARRDPPDWTRPGFDDSGWAAANTKLESARGALAWSYLEPRQTPRLREREVFPRRVVATGEVPETRVDARGVPDLVAREPHLALTHASVEDVAGILAADGAVARLRQGVAGESAGDGARRAPLVLVDFGRPIFGFPRVRLKAPAGRVVDFAYGTRLLTQEDAAVLAQSARVKATLPDPERNLVGRLDLPYMPAARLADRYITRDGEQTWQVFQPRPVRYLLVVCREADEPVEIDAVSVVSFEYPAEQRGRFESSDPLLDRLWQACIDTTYLHLEDTLVCDAVRERRPWTGDGTHGMLGVFAGWGNLALNDWYFRLVARGQLPDGMLRMSYPGREHALAGGSARPDSDNHLYVPHAGMGIVTQPSAENPLNIPQFAFFYTLALAEHHRVNGHLGLIGELYPVLLRVAEWCERHSDATGLLYGLPNWNFVDWVRTDYRGANLETNALYYRTLVELAGFARDLGRVVEAEGWRARAARVRDAIRRLHWNERRGLFAAGYFEEAQSTIFTETGNGLALLFGIAEGDQVRRIVGEIGRSGSEMSRGTPLFFLYTLEGLMRVGAAETALALVRERYRAMMQASDVPTVWEYWSPNHRQDQNGRRNVQIASPIHSGSAGPAWVMSKYLLGVRPLTAGFASCRIEPAVGELPQARGIVPTGRGDIAVAWRREQRNLRLEISLPPGTTAELVLPHPRDQPARVRLNGEDVQVRRLPSHDDPTVLADDADRLALSLPGGRHEVLMQAP